MGIFKQAAAWEVWNPQFTLDVPKVNSKTGQNCSNAPPQSEGAFA
jgi:hypothetical protein